MSIPTQELEKLNNAYSERNRLAIALAIIVNLNGGKAGYWIDDNTGWDDEWRVVVGVDLWGMQISFHISPDEFAFGWNWITISF